MSCLEMDGLPAIENTVFAVFILVFNGNCLRNSMGVKTPQQHHVTPALSSVRNNNDRPPHIVFILADDLGFNDVGFHGSRQVRTPHIDRLAAEGIILDNYYVTPLCSPSRSALLTGRYPIHTGMQHDVLLANTPYGLGLDETLLPQYLKRYGYATHMIGKWHQGFYTRNYTPTFRGFDTYFGYYCADKDYFDHTEIEDDMWGLDLRDGTEVAYNYNGSYTTDLFTSKAVEVINAHNTSSSQPLFMYLAHMAVHTALPAEPLQTTAERYNRFPNITHEGRRKFNGMLAALDDSVGQIFAALEAQKLTDNVIFVFSSDNGGAAAGFGLNFGSNWPLRGMKAGLWEGGVRASGFIWSPRLQKTGYRSNHLMHISDWLPTLVGQAAGSTASGPVYDKVLDGVDMWQTLSENAKESARDELVVNIDQVYNTGALRRADGWKILLGGKFDTNYDGWYAPESDPALQSTVSCGLKSNDTRYACQPRQKKPCLFNITEDPCEWRNVAWKYPEVLQQLTERMDHYKKSAVEPRNRPADARANPKYHNYVWTWWLEDYRGEEEELDWLQKSWKFTGDNGGVIAQLLYCILVPLFMVVISIVASVISVFCLGGFLSVYSVITTCTLDRKKVFAWYDDLDKPLARGTRRRWNLQEDSTELSTVQPMSSSPRTSTDATELSPSIFRFDRTNY